MPKLMFMGWKLPTLPPLTYSASAPMAAMEDPTKDRAALAEEYRTTECAVQKAAAQGAVTDVVTQEQTRTAVFAYMEMLAGKRVSKLPKKHANIRL